MNLSLRGARRATATAMTAALATAGLLTSACTANSSTTKTISGTIKGADGRIVDVLLGFDVIDGAGHKMDLGGGRVGYSAITRLNHCVPASGATAPQTCPVTGRVTGYNWSIVVPAAAQTVYIEVYPKRPTITDWLNNYQGYTGVAAGSTDTTTYGMTYKRALPLGGNLSNVSIVLPKQCGQPGGSTGTLYGHIAGWYGVTGRVNAWSMAPNTLPTQGFGIGTVDVNGNYRINGLQTGQRYGLIASGPGQYHNVVNFYNATHNDTVIPATCFQRNYNF